VIYALHTVTAAPRRWPEVARVVKSEGAAAVREAGGIFYGVWWGLIGLASTQGMVMSAWPDERAAPNPAGNAVIPARAHVVESTIDLLVATVRPTEPTPPDRPGVYAFRTFELAEDDWPNFRDLSLGVWPTFEPTYDARVYGLFHILAVAPPRRRMLRLTNYPSMAAWEKSRLRTLHTGGDAGAPEAKANLSKRLDVTTWTRVVIGVPA
jgi:hypothetical protein